MWCHWTIQLQYEKEFDRLSITKCDIETMVFNFAEHYYNRAFQVRWLPSEHSEKKAIDEQWQRWRSQMFRRYSRASMYLRLRQFVISYLCNDHAPTSRCTIWWLIRWRLMSIWHGLKTNPNDYCFTSALNCNRDCNCLLKGLKKFTEKIWKSMTKYNNLVILFIMKKRVSKI